MKKGSETVVIKRSEIQMNPANIKAHTEREVDLQKKNLRKVGFLGGVTWNRETGRLIDGHRRIKAMDIINKYDGTPETDYDIKVEAVEFDEQTEKQQMAFMAMGNSKADYNLVAKIIDEIDYRDVGITEEDYKRIRELAPVEAPEVGMQSFDDDFISPYEPVTDLDDSDERSVDEIIKEHEEKPKMTKEQVKAEKQKCDKVAFDRQEVQDLYVFLSFSTLENKVAFCELLELPPTNSMMVPGEKVLGLIE